MNAESHPPPPQGPPKSWLDNHTGLVILFLILVSSGLRVTYFMELNRGPLVNQHRSVPSDMHFFDAWAKRIASGDWLTDTVLHPHLGWHQALTKAYLKKYPGELRDLREKAGAEAQFEELSQILWNRWYGEKQFNQEPLYPYLLAATYKLFGADVRWVFAWQLVLGTLANVLIYLIARRFFGSTTGLIAGMLATLSGPLLFYEMVLLRSSLITVTGLVLVFLVSIAIEKQRWSWWLFAGLAIGASLLVKATFASYALGTLLLTSYLYRRSASLLLRPIVGVLCGSLVCLLPAIARNVSVGAPALSLSSAGSLAFVLSNTVDYPPQQGFFLSFEHVPGVLHASQGRFGASVFETLKTHSPGSYLRQAWGKFASTWNWYEKPNNANFYYYRLHSAVLRWLPVTFWILAPLGLVGLCIAAPRLQRCAPLYLLVLTSLAPLILFYVLSRFRVSLAAAVIPFAALTLVEVFGAARRRAWGRAAVISGAVLVAFLWTAQPLPAGETLVRATDYYVPLKLHYSSLAAAAARRGEWSEVARISKEALQYEPPMIAEIGVPPLGRLPTRAEAPVVTCLANLYGMYGEALKKTGQEEEAAGQERRAQELLQAVR